MLPIATPRKKQSATIALGNCATRCATCVRRYHRL